MCASNVKAIYIGQQVQKKAEQEAKGKRSEICTHIYNLQNSYTILQFK